MLSELTPSEVCVSLQNCSNVLARNPVIHGAVAAPPGATQSRLWRHQQSNESPSYTLMCLVGEGKLR